MKWYILYNCNDHSSTVQTHKERIDAETLEIALQKYNAFKDRLQSLDHSSRVLGLERIDQEEIVTKIF